MSIKQSGPNRWHIVAAVRYRGKILRAVRRGFTGAYSKAVSEEARLKSELRAGAEKRYREQANKALFFSGLMDAFEQAGKYPARMECYANRLRSDIGKVHIDSLETTLLRYFAALNTSTVQGKKKDKNGEWERTQKPLSGPTKNRILAIARMVCRHAYRVGLIPGDPLKLVRPWPEKARNRILSPEELAAIRGAIETEAPWLSPAFEFSIRIPIRLGDLVCLTHDNIDFFNGVIRLVARKTGAAQVAPIPPELLEYFKSVPREREYLFYRFKAASKGLGSFHKAWLKVLTTAKVSGIRWHDLRHHACSWLANDVGLTTGELMVTGGWKRREMIEVYHNVHADRTAQGVAGRLQAHHAEQQKKIAELKTGAAS